MHGRDFSAHCVAPNVGLLCLRIPVPDLQRYVGEITARGAAAYADSAMLEVAPYGRLQMFSTRSPEGAILEFFEPGR